MTAKQFKELTGDEPHDDDLERANCPSAGTPGHFHCGICKHGLPVFKCQPCFVEDIARKAWKQTN